MKLPADIVDRLRDRYAARPVLVTGGAGFIGSHLTDALLDLGARVSVLDDLSAGLIANLSDRLESEPERLTFHHASVLDRESLTVAIGGAHTVFHLAAVGSVQRSVEDPERTLAVNSTGTARVLDAARHAKAHRVILASSSSVYGDAAPLPAPETSAPRPRSPYAASKLAGEHLAAAWSSTYGLDTLVLRYFNVFGPRQRADTAYAAAIAAFATSVMEGRAPSIFGDGKQSRDFTPVANVVLGTLLAGAAERRFEGEPVNLALGRETTVDDLARAIAKALGKPELEPTHTEPRAGEVRHSRADVTRAHELLGFEPFGSFDDALAETARWYAERDNPDPDNPDPNDMGSRAPGTPSETPR